MVLSAAILESTNPIVFRLPDADAPSFDEDAEFDSDEDDSEPPLIRAMFGDLDADKIAYYNRLFVQLNQRIDASYVPDDVARGSSLLRAIEAHKQGKLNTDLSKRKWANVRRFFPPERRHGSPLMELPIEVLNTIMQYATGHCCYGLAFDADDRWRETCRALGGVCVTFYELVQSVRFLTITLKTAYECMQFLHLLRSSHNLRLHIRRIIVQVTALSRAVLNDYHASLSEICRLCPNARSLDIRYEQAGIHFVEPVRRDNTEKLAFSFVRWLAVSSLDNATSVPVVSFLSGFSNLTCLTLSRVNLELMQPPSKKWKQMPTVGSLMLEYMSLSNRSVRMLAAMFPKLESVAIAGVPYGGIEFVSLLLSKPDNVMSFLSMADCMRPGQPLRIPKKFWTDLKQIWMRRTSTLSADSLPSAEKFGITSLPKLYGLRLDLSLCRLKNHEFDEFLAALDRLRAMITPPLDGGVHSFSRLGPSIDIECSIAERWLRSAGLSRTVQHHKLMWTEGAERVVKTIDSVEKNSDGAKYLKQLRKAALRWRPLS
ncbi:uncharacterized protein V1518DRAFT_408246 [Limtongia smithiae]|uniref:uncharacterized protein n=1 Tax=Limtongia smithiae TaxID=1125753 RepID=UPI0034CEFF3F